MAEWRARTLTQTFNAANQVDGFTYAGNLTNDGTTTFTYDALNRMIGSGGTTYTYNGDGVLVDDGTTRYTQDLASPLSQVLQTTQGSTTTDYLYGRDRLALVAGSTRTWYGADALGSVRLMLDDGGTLLGTVNYDAWGQVETGSVPVFGFTGEVQDAASGLVNLRARWYSTTRGTLTSRDPFAGVAETPYSQHPYQYGYSDPILNSDPSGKCIDKRVPIFGEPGCRIEEGVLKGKLDYTGAAHVAVTGSAIAVTVAGCAVTATLLGLAVSLATCRMVIRIRELLTECLGPVYSVV